MSELLAIIAISARGFIVAATSKIRVGIVGASPNRGFASIAHIPALQALPGLEIAAVCTTRQESADATAKHFGIPLAFADPAKLAQHPDVDLVTVCVKVPDHYQPVMAAIDAGKHVYCEWPLGRNTDDAVRMLDAAERKGVRHAVGLQGQVSPAMPFTTSWSGEVFATIPASSVAMRSRWLTTKVASSRNSPRQWHSASIWCPPVIVSRLAPLARSA